jgi:hypothetical protein
MTAAILTDACALSREARERKDQLSADHRRAITAIFLVDNGIRGADFLQQELTRATR